MVFETYAYPFGYFRRCKIDEILMSFYPWFSPYDIAYLIFFFKSSQVFAKHRFASVFIEVSPNAIQLFFKKINLTDWSPIDF